ARRRAGGRGLRRLGATGSPPRPRAPCARLLGPGSVARSEVNPALETPQSAADRPSLFHRGPAPGHAVNTEVPSGVEATGCGPGPRLGRRSPHRARGSRRAEGRRLPILLPALSFSGPARTINTPVAVRPLPSWEAGEGAGPSQKGPLPCPTCA